MRVISGKAINAINVTALSQNCATAVSVADNSAIPFPMAFPAAMAAVRAYGPAALASLRAEPGWQ